MSPEAILAGEPRVLSQAQREFYFEYGYLLIEELVSREWIDRLRAATEEMMERSRGLLRSDGAFGLGTGHTPERPRLRRLDSPVEHHPVFWEFASRSILPDVVADLVGPNVKFHHSKLDFTPAEEDAPVEWSQDITSWPHTDYAPLTCGVYLSDCGPEDGPLTVVPGTHRGDLFSSRPHFPPRRLGSRSETNSWSCRYQSASGRSRTFPTGRCRNPEGLTSPRWEMEQNPLPSFTPGTTERPRWASTRR
jgi:ectoine hydroxylase-related dioxygenase (phytanoyl-CoA dioxygenase family)